MFAHIVTHSCVPKLDLEHFLDGMFDYRTVVSTGFAPPQGARPERQKHPSFFAPAVRAPVMSQVKLVDYVQLRFHLPCRHAARGMTRIRTGNLRFMRALLLTVELSSRNGLGMRSPTSERTSQSTYLFLMVKFFSRLACVGKVPPALRSTDCSVGTLSRTG
jgi:hypothetical protein